MTACRYCIIYIKCHDRTSCVLNHCSQYLYLQGVCPDLKLSSVGQCRANVNNRTSKQIQHTPTNCAGKRVARPVKAAVWEFGGDI